MAVSNIFSDLNKPTGNFLTFSQYSEDLTKGATQYEAYRVVPSKFIVMNVDYKKVQDKLSQYDIEGNLNNTLPKYFQDYFENGCAYLRKNYKGNWSPNHAANMFWNTLYKADMLTTTEDEHLNYFINEVRYIGDINIQSYDEKNGDGYSEIYCYIPTDSKAYKYGTIDLKPDESPCDCAPYTAQEVDDRIQYIDPYTIDYEPWTGEENESLEMYMDDPKMWSGKTVCQCGCESYDTQEIKDALEECDCYPYTQDEIGNRIEIIDPYTSMDVKIPEDNTNMWTGPSIGKDGCESYENPSVALRISNINPVTSSGNNIEDYQDDPNMWDGDSGQGDECCRSYQTNEIKNRLNELNDIDETYPVIPDEENNNEELPEHTDEDSGNGEHCGCEYCSNIEPCNCIPLTESEIENRIENLNPRTAVAVSEDWKYLKNYSDNPNIWDDREALEALFEEMDDYEIISEQTNTAIRNYYNENDYLEGFEGNEKYSIADCNDILRIYYADNSLLDKAWIDSRAQLDPTIKDLYEFNTIVVLYEIHKINKQGQWTIYNDLKNLPLGIYFTGKFNDDLTLTNPVTKYIDNDEIYKEGTAYGLRICYRFAVTPLNVSIKSVNIEQENDNYSAFCQVMTEMSKTQQKMQDIISSVINQTQFLKDTLSIFKNSKINTPYLREVNGENYWFVNGKMLGPATVTQTTPVYIDNTTVFPNVPTINDVDVNPDLDNPIKFAPVNTTSFNILNNGCVGESANEEMIIEVEYGNADLVNEPFIISDWIKEIKEI